MGYRPNSLASGLRTNSTRSIGLIIHDMNDPVYPPILSGIEAQLAPQEFVVLVGNTGYDLKSELELVDRMAAQMVDGLFLATTRLDDPVVRRCRDYAIPVVSVLRFSEDDFTPAVINDCYGGMRDLVQHAIALGHRDLAHIGAPQTLSTARERLHGYRDALAEAGFAMRNDRLTFVTRMTVEGGEQATRRLLAEAESPPSVLICVNDLVALGALRACRDVGLRVPEDISITGYNNIPLVGMIDPPLTTVKMDLDRIGRTAGAVMLDLLLGKSDPPSAKAAQRIRRIASTQIPRASLAPARTG
nr:LacI family DNA-binding transcriptional regulator [Pseudohoeflea sp. DP4N28-3]